MTSRRCQSVVGTPEGKGGLLFSFSLFPFLFVFHSGVSHMPTSVRGTGKGQPLKPDEVDLLQNRLGQGEGGQYTIMERTPVFSLGVPPPTRFTLPATRGNTSLNAKDW